MNKAFLSAFLVAATALMPGCSEECAWQGDALEGMIQIPAGEFIAGCDSASVPEHVDWDCSMSVLNGARASVHGFYIDEYEVTNSEYAEFLNCHGNQCDGESCYSDCAGERVEPARIFSADGAWSVEPGFESHPVVDISWAGAKSFCEWRGGRLPSQIEWEYAARGTRSGTYPWGDQDCQYCAANGLSQYLEDGMYVGPIDDLSAECREYLAAPMTTKALPVGCFIRDISQFGVHDMGGSVSEVMEDDYYSFGMYFGQVTSWDEFIDMIPLDGTAWITDPRSSSRAVHGGSATYWLTSFGVLAIRIDQGAFCGTPRVGFRCAADD